MARTRTWRRIVAFVFFLIFAAIVYRWISLEQLIRTAALATETPTPAPTPTRPPVVTGKIDTGKIFNGVTLHSRVETPPGADATTERNDPDSYAVELKLEARLPAPNKSIDELAKVSPRLPELLPGLAAMMNADAVSPLYVDLYNNKVRIARDNLAHLDQLLSRHNFYDCQTVLQMQHPQSRRRAMLVQADMDVDADGSDSDRMPAQSGAPTNFKPFTSYKWNKKTPAPNPYLPAIEDKLRRAEEELKTATPERKKDLRNAIVGWRDQVGTLKKFSFLIGAADPYIVMPGLFARAKDGPKVGDYAVVIFADAIYPALVGDIGPNDKVGEASLRIAKEINAQSNPYNRPVSDLKVTYLIFPGTADTPWGPPDYDKMRERCQKFVDEIGGATVPLHQWTNIIPPPPTPAPSPSPSISATSTIAPSPAGSTSPSPSPVATFAFPLPSEPPK